MEKKVPLKIGLTGPHNGRIIRDMKKNMKKKILNGISLSRAEGESFLLDMDDDRMAIYICCFSGTLRMGAFSSKDGVCVPIPYYENPVSYKRFFEKSMGGLRARTRPAAHTLETAKNVPLSDFSGRGSFSLGIREAG